MSAPAISEPTPKVVPSEPPRSSAPAVPLRVKPTTMERRKAQWFALFFCSICFEGLGRKYLSVIPGEAFYFLKDALLIYGLVSFRMDPRIMKVIRIMYRPFGAAVALALMVSIVQVFNTGIRASFLLGVLGLRAYWLWCVAVPVVANVLLSPYVRRRGIFVLAFVSTVVAMFAVIQFGSPSTSATNTYAIHAGQEVAAYEVGSTGRARVSSTFTFITGFTDFVVLIPALLLSVGLGETDRRTRLIATTAAMLSSASLPMSGSRAPFVVGLFLLAMVAREAGFLFTRVGRRVIVVGAVAIFAVIYIFPDSLQGVMDRFDSEDTDSRFSSIYTVLPPVAMATIDYPPLGTGTGMQQNFRNLFGVDYGEYESELEVGRYLIELGAPGYLFVWITRVGLMVAFLRAAKLFRKANRRAAAGAATAYAILTFYGNLTFDHIWQSLYFTGSGFILQELVTVWPILYPNRSRGVTVTAPAPASVPVAPISAAPALALALPPAPGVTGRAP